MTHIAYAEAFKRKEELGGGWRSVFKNNLTGEVFKSDVLPSVEEAWNVVRVHAHASISAVLGEDGFSYSAARWKKNANRRAFYYRRRIYQQCQPDA